MPFVPALRFLALALVIVAAARPQIGDAREVIRGGGGGYSHSPGYFGKHGADGLRSAQNWERQSRSSPNSSKSGSTTASGLVVFSQEAFIQSPPTLDHDVLLRLLSDVHLADQLGIEDGTAIGRRHGYGRLYAEGFGLGE